MKRLVVFSLISLFVGTAMGQITHTEQGVVDKNADKILKRAAQKLNEGTVSFSVTMVSNDQDKKEQFRQKADILYNKGKYRATIANNVIYCDGTTTWHWNKADKEVTINNITQSEDDLMNPGYVLANYTKNFRSKFIRQESDGTAVIDLTPKKSKSYYKIRLLIDANSGLLKRLEMHNYDSSSAIFTVSAFKSAVKSTAADFSFPSSKLSENEVIDMR